MYDQKQVDEGRTPTTGHTYWFSDNPEWLISAWVAAGVQISDDHGVQKKMLTALWTKRRADVLRLLQMYVPPTENLIHAAVQHIRQAMPRVGVTMDARLFVSGCLDRPRQGLIPFLFRMHCIFCQSVGLILKFKFIKLDV